MPQSRNQYRVVESFADQVGLGKEYAKVIYKGTQETGYIARVNGPGKPITKDWYNEKKRQQPDDIYRVTIAANREYENKQPRFPGWESWTISFESTTYRGFDNREEALDAGVEKLDDIAELVAEEIKPFDDIDAKPKKDAELSVEATKAQNDANYRPWSPAVLTVEFSGGGLDGSTFTYDLDVENEKIKWQ